MGNKIIMSPTNPRDSLSQTLTSWRIKPPSDPNFRPAIWARIQRRAGDTWTGYLRAHLAGWSAVALVAVGVAGWTGHAAAQAKLESNREQMVVSYLGELDPRVMAKLRP
jgi:hypothetical protein